MKKEGANWVEGLKAYVAECRASRPIMDRKDLSTAEEMQCRIIGDSLISAFGSLLIREKTTDANHERPDKVIVFTTEQPGLVAAREIFKNDNGTVVFLCPAEFADWEKSHPDFMLRWHWHEWSYFAPLDSETKKEAEKYPLAAGESFWMQVEGLMMGWLAGNGCSHLWKWNGHEPVLLQKDINGWLS